MNIYAYNHQYNQIEQIDSSVVPSGLFAGEVFADTFVSSKKTKKDNNEVIVALPDGDRLLLDIINPSDVIITSSLTNFSLDFISALQTVAILDANGIRVIAYQEDFDTANHNVHVLLESLPLMQKICKSSYETTKANRLAGIKKAIDEGKYQGRSPYGLDKFPEFETLYNQYMTRKFNKEEFAKKLGISRPTLDKLIAIYLKKM